MSWLVLAREDDEEIEIFRTADRLHIETLGRWDERRGGLPEGGNISADVLPMAEEERWFDAIRGAPFEGA